MLIMGNPTPFYIPTHSPNPIDYLGDLKTSKRGEGKEGDEGVRWVSLAILFYISNY